MRPICTLAIALPLLLTVPVAGQDFLGPLEDLVEQITAPPPSAEPERVEPPVARPEVEAPVVAPIPRPRPPDLPDVPQAAEPGVPAAADEPDEAPAAAEDEEPAVVEQEPADDRVYQAACPAVIMGLVEAEMAAPLSEGICGERSPLTVTAVLSRGRMVPLSSPVTTNCQMATALPDWVETVDGYAETVLESRLLQVDVGTGYMCRARNNASAGFTSEHGFANALDVVGFTLEDGRALSVAGDWGEQPAGRLLRLAHDAACGSFTTVLGPEANAEHEDHLHLDLGCHGQTCTARICE